MSNAMISSATDQLREAAGLGAKLEPARGRVGARRIDLEGRDCLERRQTLDHMDVISDRCAGNVHEDPSALQPLRQPGELVLRNPLHPGIGEADRVEHAAAKLRDPQRGMTLTRLRSYRLGNDAAEPIEIDHVIELASKSGGAGGKKNWILESRSEQFDGTHGRSGRTRRSRGIGRAPGGRTGAPVAVGIAPGAGPPSARPGGAGTGAW